MKAERRRRKGREWTFRPRAVQFAYACDGCGRTWAVFASPGDEPDIRGCPGCGLPLTEEYPT